jgi:transposase-like protein
MSDMQCPYCGAEQEVCHDDGHGYEENVRHEHQCTECEKTFVFETSVSFYYEPSKADCLNGAPHDLVLTKTWPKEYTRWCCKHCDYERAMTDAERDAHGIPQRAQKGGAA